MKVLSSFGLRSLHLIHILCLLCHGVVANTEIITFSTFRALATDLPLDVLGNWSTLRPTENERRWFIEPAALHTPLHHVCDDDEWTCPHALWLVLDLDDPHWASYVTFTLRLSWPASVRDCICHVLSMSLRSRSSRLGTQLGQTPADFEITLYTPHALCLFFGRGGSGGGADGTSCVTAPHTSSLSSSTMGTTRVRYARIRAVHTGVAVPALSPPRSTPPRAPRRIDEEEEDGDAPAREQRRPGSAGPAREGEVPFVVILEPVYGGLLPATLLPTFGLLVLVVLAAATLVFPRVTAYLDPWVRQAHEDVHTRTKAS